MVVAVVDKSSTVHYSLVSTRNSYISLSRMMLSQASGCEPDAPRFFARPEVASFLVSTSFLEQLQLHFLGMSEIVNL